MIARAPHSVWDQASLPPVRDHIRGRLAGLGLTVTTSRPGEVTDTYGHTYPLENISASLPGRSGSSVLLVSHYDSAPGKRRAESDGSCGAADDGYGVAAMLEIAGILVRAGEGRENGVRFLFTDAEETGLLGARAEMAHNLAAYQDVNLVINFEARGNRGPAVMFETGRNNLATIRLFRRAHRAFAYSFAPDVYRRMPNGTDFTVFSRLGYAGLNFAVLEDLSTYHTPLDNPANISLASLQHYGDQVLPVVRAYAEDRRYAGRNAFTSREDAVFFSWLPGVFLCWSAETDRILAELATLAFVVWAGWNLARGRARAGAAGLWFLGWAAVAVLALGTGLGACLLAGRLTGLPWHLTYMPNVPLERGIFGGLVLLLAVACRALAGWRGGGGRSRLLGALGLQLALLWTVAFVLPGGTFLFSVPLLAALACLAAADLAGRPWLALVAVALTASLFVPVLHLLFLALTLGALGPVLLLAAFPLSLLGCLAAEGELVRS